jgi:hypothetical protein
MAWNDMQLHWTAGIGDPSPLGWFTVVAYLVTAALCGCAMARARSLSQRSVGFGLTEQQFWLAMTVIFLCLGINKQLDLQSLFTEIGRTLARSEGWYRNRRTYQLAFIEGLALIAVALVALLLWIFRRSHPTIRMALLGVVFTTAFVVLRAASFHHVDRFLKTGFLGWRWNWIIELTGIAIVAIAALRYCLQIAARPRR